jgi:hypothetical protein
MARKNLKPKKFRGGGSYQGGRTDTPPGAAKAGPVERPGNYQEKQITGPVDPGIPTESITSFNAIGAARDTIVGRKAMNMSPTITAAQKLQTVGAQDNQAVTCPPGYINVGGQCVKQASKGGAMKYYKGLL